MTIIGYHMADLYEALQLWWTGDGTLSDVEMKLGAKHPFLHTFFFQSHIIDIRGFKEEGVTFQDAMNILMMHLILLGFRKKKAKIER